MDLAQILDLGMTGILAAGLVGLWRSHQQQAQYIQALLSAELDRQDNDIRAEKQRKKLGRAVGVDLDEDTQGKRPAGFDAAAARRRDTN